MINERFGCGIGGGGAVWEWVRCCITGKGRERICMHMGEKGPGAGLFILRGRGYWGWFRVGGRVSTAFCLIFT